MYSVENSILQRITTQVLDEHKVKLFIKRDDLIHEEVSGNKWRKLKYNIKQLDQLKNEGVLTFGGAFSNHLLATASACNERGLKCIGIVRGDELNATSNETLANCSKLGMQLIFVSRNDYQKRNEKSYQDYLSGIYPNYFIVPEGGANYYGLIGCQEIWTEIDEKIDEVFIAQGTTTTSCGLLMGCNDEQRLNVVPVLKGFNSIEEMTQLFKNCGFDNSWIEEKMRLVKAHQDYHFGGYGKVTKELIGFIQTFYKLTGIKLDPVYTGKVMKALWDMINDGKMNNKKVLFIHSGGLQGVLGIEQKMGVNLFE